MGEDTHFFVLTFLEKLDQTVELLDLQNDLSINQVSIDGGFK